jgi:hypothetical protein
VHGQVPLNTYAGGVHAAILKAGHLLRGNSLAVREIARKFGVGRLVYHIWHAPRGAIERLGREGLINLSLAAIGRIAMENAALKLDPLPEPARHAPEIFYLTGHRFVRQTIFCAVSLSRQAAQSFRFVAVDDGTLRNIDIALLRHKLPGIRIVDTREVEATLDARLPTTRFPELRRRRLVYPHLRKITDVHCGGGGWKLVLDSDMLFHGRPHFILDWLDAPDRPCHMLDIADAYGYSPRLLRELAGFDLPSRLNVGICGLNSDSIDWEKVEYWCGRLVEREGTHYYMEQAIVAMLTAGKPRAVAAAESYVVSPCRFEAEHPAAVLHHYTAASKAWYFRFAWRHVTAGIIEESSSSESDADAQTAEQ